MRHDYSPPDANLVFLGHGVVIVVVVVVVLIIIIIIIIIITITITIMIENLFLFSDFYNPIANFQ